MEKLMTQQKMHEAQERQRAHVQKFIDRFRFNAKRASLVQSRIKMMAKVELIPEVIEDPTMAFTFPSAEQLKYVIVSNEVPGTNHSVGLRSFRSKTSRSATTAISRSSKNSTSTSTWTRALL
jgi:ATPase subunit of ABC transporter with duplicated ATPase domains